MFSSRNGTVDTMDSSKSIFKRVNIHYYISVENIEIVGKIVPEDEKELSELYLPTPDRFQSHIAIDIEKISGYIYDAHIKQLVQVPFTSFLKDNQQVYIAMPDMKAEVLVYAKKCCALYSKSVRKQKILSTSTIRADNTDEESNVEVTKKRKVFKNTLERTLYHEEHKDDKEYRDKR
tara:strand:+ start:375 stop:905 length:531 start_codon:yes stop_codon:yes gene_type:complete